MKNELKISEELGWMKELNNINFPNKWNKESIEKILIHLKHYRIENRQLVTPTKGLFLVSRYTEEPIFFYKLLCHVINRLYIDTEQANYYDRVQQVDKIKPLLVTPSELRRELFQLKKPDDLIRKYLGRKILFLDSIGNEKIVKLNNYNEFDLIPELIDELYLYQRLSEINTPFYVISHCTTRQLKKRYSKETLFHLSRLTEGVVISSPTA